LPQTPDCAVELTPIAQTFFVGKKAPDADALLRQYSDVHTVRQFAR
jgi:hypothetical protein